MDTGNGIAAGTAIVSAAVIVIKAMCLWHDSKKARPQIGREMEGCPHHKGILERLKIGDGQFLEVCKDIKVIKRVLLLLVRSNPDIDDATMQELVE